MHYVQHPLLLIEEGKGAIMLRQLKVFNDRKNTVQYIDITRIEDYTFHNNKVVSLFSGAGGLDIGLECAGFETAACVEIDPDCRETLKYNRPQWRVFEDDHHRISGDIRSISPEELLEFAGLRRGETALVVGGAPCQPFSNIGKKSGKDAPVNGALFIEFVRPAPPDEPAQTGATPLLVPAMLQQSSA